MIRTMFKRPRSCMGTVTLALFLLTGCGNDAPPEEKEIVRPVKLMKIDAGAEAISLEFPGEVTAARSVELGFEVAGKIIELPISDGITVEKGAILARLDNTDYLAARDSAQANQKAAQSAYERAKRIFDQGAGSQAEVDNTLRDIDIATQNLKQAEKSLSDTVLTAPFSGRVARKIADNFQNVQAKQAILLLEETSALELEVSVPEQDFARMTPGLTPAQRTQRAKPEIEVSAHPGRRFPASLESFETAADPVTRTYKAAFAFENPADVNVLPGMTAKVVLQIPTDAHRDTESGMMIPASASVIDSQGDAYVWRYDPESSQVSRASVTLGEMSGDSVRVLDGLHEGDQIAISGAAYLSEGMKVRPLAE